MPSREQLLALLSQGVDLATAARRSGIPAGQAYLIATGTPADGSTRGEPGEPWWMPSTQHLCNPPHENPTGGERVREWVRARAEADPALVDAGARRLADSRRNADLCRGDAIDVLTHQHNRLVALTKKLTALPGGRAGTPARTTLVGMIDTEWARHVAIEARTWWPAVRRLLPEAAHVADGVSREDAQAARAVAEALRASASTGESDEHVRTFFTRLRRHVAAECRLFLDVRERATQQQLDELGRSLAAAMTAAVRSA